MKLFHHCFAEDTFVGDYSCLAVSANREIQAYAEPEVTVRIFEEEGTKINSYKNIVCMTVFQTFLS